jgi:hypothetical protein
MSTSKRKVPYIIGVVFIVYALGRALLALPSLEKPRILDDTAAYVRISGAPIEGIEFWGGSRPPAFPFLLRITDRDFNLTATLQLACSIIAWGLLALMVSRFMEPAWLRLLAFCLILGFSLDRHISGWDSVMMTESLSVSSLALFIAACAWLLRGWHAAKVVVFFVAAFVLAFTRDTNAWMLLALSLLILLAIAVHWAKVQALILAAGLACIFVLSNASATLGDRWVFPLANLITRRILPNAAALQYFESCGMPVSPALMQLSGGFANSDSQAIFSGPDLDDFRYWLRDHGKSCYVGWLIANPVLASADTLHEAGSLIAFSTVDRFFSRQYDPVLPALVGQVFYPERFPLWIWGYTTLAALIVVWKRCWNDNALWALFACMTLLVFPHLFLTWHGDAMAPDRHALSVGVQLYLAGLLLTILLLQYLWRRVRKPA